MRQITFVPTFAAWQKAARRALADSLTPDEIVWEEWGVDQPALALFDEHDEFALTRPSPRFRVPKDFLAMAARVACHRDLQRWALLYRMLWRLTHDEPRLLEITVDPAVYELVSMDKSVRRDVHKMRAFVRFRQVHHAGAAWYVAWFEPEHRIIEYNAPFFRDRFAQMSWSILSPGRCVHWDGAQLSFTDGVPRSEAPDGDEVESLWLTYYGNIFNPARVKKHAMQAEMPKRYWKNLPEATLIPALLNDAPSRVRKMRNDSAEKTSGDKEGGAAVPPDSMDLAALREAARECHACPLWKNATQTVFGEGPPDAALVIVGEQPGDSEDLAGRPFVGPAGELLDRALAEAGVERAEAYVTNAVKHFKWEPRGKRRIHEKPGRSDIAACRPWLAAEFRTLRPKVVLCLGATAAASVFGRQVRVLSERGTVKASSFCDQTIVTVHPSMLLRIPDEASCKEQYESFVADLRAVGKLL